MAFDRKYISGVYIDDRKRVCNVVLFLSNEIWILRQMWLFV